MHSCLITNLMLISQACYMEWRNERRITFKKYGSRAEKVISLGIIIINMFYYYCVCVHDSCVIAVVN